jgi:hypothetical protein
MADWIIAHHNAALDQRERDCLLRWAAARRAMVPTTPPN